MRPRSSRTGLYLALFAGSLVAPLVAKPTSPPFPLGTVQAHVPTEYPPPDSPETLHHDDPFNLMPAEGIETIGIVPIAKLPHLAHFRSNRGEAPFLVAGRFLPRQDLPATPCSREEHHRDGACADYLLAVEQYFVARTAPSETSHPAALQALLGVSGGEPLGTALAAKPGVLDAFQAVREHARKAEVPEGLLARQAVSEQSRRLRLALAKNGVARLRLSTGRGGEVAFRSLLVIAGRAGVGTMLSGRHRRLEAYRVVDPTLSFALPPNQKLPFGMLYLDARYGTVAFEPGDEDLQWAFPQKRASPSSFYVFHPHGSPETEDRVAVPVAASGSLEDGLERLHPESMQRLREIIRSGSDG